MIHGLLFREMCMDLVSLETSEENMMVEAVIKQAGRLYSNLLQLNSLFQTKWSIPLICLSSMINPFNLFVQYEQSI